MGEEADVVDIRTQVAADQAEINLEATHRDIVELVKETLAWPTSSDIPSEVTPMAMDENVPSLEA